jgi:hypothetical protein
MLLFEEPGIKRKLKPLLKEPGAQLQLMLLFEDEPAAEVDAAGARRVARPNELPRLSAGECH